MSGAQLDAMDRNASAPRAALVLATCVLASSLAFVDGSVVNVGLPSIGQNLNASGTALSWVLDAYLLPLSALLLIGGAAGDHFGRRRLLVLGTVLFGLASLLCSFAPTLSILLAGRIFQGIGAALLMPNSLAILGTSFSGEARGRAIGIWAASGAAGGALAPLLGGWLIDQFGWRSIFLINLPIALTAIMMALRYVPETRPSHPTPLDTLGGVLATVALFAMTWSLSNWSADARLDSSAALVLIFGVVMALLFLFTEHRRGDHAMLPLVIFRSPEFVGLTMLTLLLYGALGAVLVFVPFTLITQQSYGATAAGAALLPLPIVIALASAGMGRLAARVGPRWPLTIGAMVVAAGCALLVRFGPGNAYWSSVFPALVVISLGMAGAVAPLTTAVLSSVDDEREGVASGFNSAIARTGGLIATALLSGLLVQHGGVAAGSFRIAALSCSAACVIASLCAFFLVGRTPQTVPNLDA